jgi:hypothetical protein
MQISRLDTLKQREEKVERYRVYATKEHNLFKAKQADYLLINILELKNQIKKQKWN